MTDFIKHPLNKAYTIDTAMNSLWEFYKKNFFMLFIISLVISFVTQFISAGLMTDLQSLQSETDPAALLEKMKGFMLPMAVVTVISLFFTVILQHYIIFNPVDHDNSIFQSLTRSLKYFVPFLLLMILLSFTGAIAIILGLFVLIVGAVFAGIYIATLYMFILPVMMLENTGTGDTISRVFSLAHKRFWINFGWVAVFIVILIVISMILSGIVLLPFSGSFIKSVFNPEGAAEVTDMAKNPVFIILTAVVNALTIPLMPIFSVILYFNSRASENSEKQEYLPDNQEDRVRVEDLYAKPYSDDHPDNPEKK